LTAKIGKVVQSTVSRHLKVLHEAGYLRCTERGTSHFYAVEQTAIRQALGDLLAYTGLPQ